MRFEELGSNSSFVFMPELEPVWAAVSLLSGEKVHSLCSEIFGAERVAAWKRSYNFLFETFQAVEKYDSLNILDFLIDMPLEQFSIERYRDMLLEMPQEEFLWRILNLEYCKDADIDTLRRALTDDSALDIVYGWEREVCGSFLVVSSFIRHSRRFITDLFSLALQMRGDELESTVSKNLQKAELLLASVRERVETVGPFACSEEKMGKTFRNRGPYSEFVFFPALLLPARAVRYFHVEGEPKRQLLFMTVRDLGHSRDDTVKALKALSDGTRYQILTMLAEKGPLRGLDIAREFSIAASTVSHHMEQLKDCGLITEEQVKNSKYYGLNRQTSAELLSELKKDLNI